MAHLAERAEAVQSISGSCAMYMQTGDGGGVSLDGALAARNPGFLRLRAWKFNQAAFDLTVTPDGLWLMTGRDAQDETPDLTLSHIAAAWSLLNGEYFHRAHEVATSPREHVVMNQCMHGAQVRAVIDRRTRVPLRFEYLDDEGIARSSLTLDRHRDVDGHIWPMRMTFLSDQARVVIVMRDLTINAEVPSAAFRPPARAVRLQ